MANPFLAFEPPAGWRHVEATDRRTSVDFARFLRRLVDEPYPDAEKVVPVLDTPSTRTPAAPYHAFDPAEARRLADRLEWHYTPKHGSWLNVAGCELPVLARQCPDRRIPDPEVLRREAAADWQFATADARTRLEKLYPVTGPDT